MNDNVVERDRGFLRERFQVTLQHGDANTGININSSCQTAEIFIIDDDSMYLYHDIKLQSFMIP